MGTISMIMDGITSFAEFLQLLEWEHTVDIIESLLFAHPMLLILIGISTFSFTMVAMYSIHQSRIYRRKVENALKKIERNRYQNY